MTNAKLLAKIKAEIESLKKAKEVSEDKDYAQFELDVSYGYDMACNDILSFLSTLESEKPMNQDGLEEEINRTYHDGSVADTSDLDHNSYENIARHFAEWGAEHLKK